MIRPEYFYDLLQKRGSDFFTGVPNSLLKNFCAYVTDTAPEDKTFIQSLSASRIFSLSLCPLT